MISYLTVVLLIMLLLAAYAVVIYRIHKKISRLANDILRLANRISEDLAITDSDLIDVRGQIYELSNTLNTIGMEIEDDECEGDCDCVDEEDVDTTDSFDSSEIDDFYEGEDFIRFKFQ